MLNVEITNKHVGTLLRAKKLQAQYVALENKMFRAYDRGTDDGDALGDKLQSQASKAEEQANKEVRELVLTLVKAAL